MPHSIVTITQNCNAIEQFTSKLYAKKQNGAKEESYAGAGQTCPVANSFSF